MTQVIRNISTSHNKIFESLVVRDLFNLGFKYVIRVPGSSHLFSIEQVGLSLNWIPSWPKTTAVIPTLRCKQWDPEAAKSSFPLVCLLLSTRATLSLSSQHSLHITLDGRSHGGEGRRISCLVDNKKHLYKIRLCHTKHGQTFLRETGLLMCLVVDNILASNFSHFHKEFKQFLFFGNKNQGEMVADRTWFCILH